MNNRNRNRSRNSRSRLPLSTYALLSNNHGDPGWTTTTMPLTYTRNTGTGYRDSTLPRNTPLYRDTSLPRNISLYRDMSLPPNTSLYRDNSLPRNISVNRERISQPWETSLPRGRTVPRYTYSDDEDRDIDIKPIPISTTIPTTVPGPGHMIIVDDYGNLINGLTTGVATTTSGNNSSVEPIRIEDINLHYAENARDHHTDQFEQSDNTRPILRRGQDYKITISFNRTLDQMTDDVRFTAKTGQNPVPGKGTLITFSIFRSSQTTGNWKARVIKSAGNDVTVCIKPDTKCIVGEWELAMNCIEKRSDSIVNLNGRREILMVILFNPWCRDDTVYMSDEHKLEEYVLNDSGCLFQGQARQIGAVPWFFGQFEEGILKAALLCLYLAFNSRCGPSLADPVQVARAVSRIVGTRVLEGRWNGSYVDGKNPQAWHGSVTILREFVKHKRALKYGQCWVFSGLVTTLCRALGIPCRSLTTFESAHDRDKNVTIDKHWKVHGDELTPLDDLNKDDVWNFHVWNDVWMKRPDLAHGYDGWQAIDATPQEQSNGTFQCGPCPVVAILNGQCDVPFDAPFIFAEVNADIVNWVQNGDGEWVVNNVEKDRVGVNISTKIADGKPIPAQLSNCDRYREDITRSYKYPEASERERLSVVNASRTTTTGNMAVYNKGNTDIKFHYTDVDNILIGSDFEICVIVENTGRDVRNVTGTVIWDVTTYTGVKLNTCRQDKFNIEINSRQKRRLTLKVTPEEYLCHVTDSAMLKLSLIARVTETGQICANQECYRLRVPDLHLKVQTLSPQVESPLSIRVTLANPLQKKTLTNCRLSIEGPGIEEKTFRLNDIYPERELKTTVEVIPLRRGHKQITATLECDQLHNIKGVTDVYIR